MNFLNKDDNNIIICKSSVKDYLLKKLEQENEFFNIKFMDFNEIKEHLYFSYDYNAIKYLIKKYNYKYDIAKMYIDNIYYVSDKTYKSKKLNKLVLLKNELDENKLLIYDGVFKTYIKDKKIYIYGYDYLNDLEEKMVSELKLLTNVVNISKEYKEFTPDVYEFSKIQDEVEFVAFKISELLEKGVNINNIKLCNVSSDYNIYIERIFNLYKMPVVLNNKTNLYTTKIGKFFLDNLNKDINITISLLGSFKEKDIVDKIINICNKYIMEDDFTLIKDLLEYDLKHTYIDNNLYKNYVELINVDDIISDLDYVFLMNFNEGEIPKTKKDEDYITDNIKTEVNLRKTVELNTLEKVYTLKNIKSIKNLIITYKLNFQNKICFKSNLLEELNYNFKEFSSDKTTYSLLSSKIKLNEKIDDLVKYNKKSNELDLLYNNFNNNLYDSYDNKFTGIDKNDFYSYINNKKTLSYSSLSNYNECSFRFLMANVLNLNPYEETFMTIVGNMYHHILEIGLLNEIDVDKEIATFLEGKEFTNKEKFFLKKLTEDLKFTLEEIRNQAKSISLDNYLFEKEIKIEKGNNLSITFKGFVDKIIYKGEQGKKIAVLIDYKTGNTDIDLGYIKYGIKLQLPVYLYLVNEELKDVSFAGFYLQKLINKDNKDLKLEGYSNSNVHILSMFDKSYENSSLVKGLRVKQDGNFYKSSKVLNDNEINKIIDITNESINNSIKNIEDAKFDINPKKSDDFNSCIYCPFNDLCFKTNNDYIEIEKDLSFLEGESYE